MNKRQYKTGVTLIEMLIVIAVLSILVTMVVTVTRYVSSKSEIELAESTLSIVTAALGEFADYGYHYTDALDGSVNYSQFKFPLDCNSNSVVDRDFPERLNYIKTTLEESLDSTNVVITSGGQSAIGSEILYFFLNSVVTSRKTLNQIDSSLITNKGDSGENLTITITRGGVERTYPLYRIMDPWGMTLHYDYYDEDENYDGDDDYSNPDKAKTFPVVTSAGPDGKFGTNDDISSR